MTKPLFIARQSAHARGLLGRIIAFVMARETLSDNQLAIDALEVAASDHVLDIGCGHGRGVQELAIKAAFVAGADPSALMAKVAAKRNKKAICDGRVRIEVASVDGLPFADQSFDKALCVHVVYFWQHHGGALKEIARVMKPSGQVVFAFHDASNKAIVETFPAEVYRFPDMDRFKMELEAAGFECRLHAGANLPVGAVRPQVLIATKRCL